MIFSVENTARWQISAGEGISIEPAADAEERALRLFTLGSAWGGLGYQRGLAVLHGSAVRSGSGAILFGGAQEQGKSTMAAAMLARGAELVSDDLARIDPGEAGRGALIYPSSSRLKLWQDAIDYFALGDQVIEPDLFRTEKFHCRIERTADVEAVELTAIVLLEWGDETKLEPLAGGEAVRAVLRDTCYRPEMLEVMERAGEQAALVSQIAGSARVYRLTRPRRFSAMTEACALIEAL